MAASAAKALQGTKFDSQASTKASQRDDAATKLARGAKAAKPKAGKKAGDGGATVLTMIGAFAVGWCIGELLFGGPRF